MRRIRFVVMLGVFAIALVGASATWGELTTTQRGTDIDGEAEDDQSGQSVALSSDGSTLAIGAPGNDENGSKSNSGLVRVYTWSGSAWTQRGSDIDGEAAFDYSGTSVALSSDGSTLAIGAEFNDGNGSNSDVGHVRVYTWSGSAWTQRGTDIDGEAAGDQSGASVALSSDGSTLAIGAYDNDGNGSSSGHVRVYTWSGSAWTQRGTDIDGEAAGDESGRSVALSSDGSTLAIGAPYNDENGSNSGHVRVYTWSGSAWTQRGTDINGEAAEDYSGWSVALSSDGSTLAIGAHQNDQTGNASGHVRVYTWSGSAWTQRGTDIDGEFVGDESGGSVALSSDGSTLAIGAFANDGDGSKSNSGHVRVYTWSGSAWTQRGTDINGEAANDYSGISVALSSAGSTLAIGAYENDGNGSNSGHVRVYLQATEPGAPAGVSAIPGDTVATVTWSPPSSDGGATITGYTVTASPGGRTCTTTTTSCIVTGLTNGTAYTFTVTATSAAGTGPASSPSNSITPTGSATPTMPKKTQWSKASVSKPLTATFTATSGTTYTIRATLKGKTVTGKCTVKGNATTCRISLKTPGTWAVAITPSRGGVKGKPATKTVKIGAR